MIKTFDYRYILLDKERMYVVHKMFKLKTMRKFIYVLLFCMILAGCKPPMIVTRNDTSTVAKCWDGSCENFFVFKSKYDRAWRWYGVGVNCKHMREKKHLVCIVNKQHPDYEYYKLKYEAVGQGVKNFKKFYPWYIENKDKYFEYVVSETVFESSHPTNEEQHIDNSTYSFKPVYEDVNIQVPVNVGRAITYRNEKRKQLIGFKRIKNEKIQTIPAGTTFCRTKVTRKVDAMTYYVEKLQ